MIRVAAAGGIDMNAKGCRYTYGEPNKCEYGDRRPPFLPVADAAFALLGPSQYRTC